MRSLIFLLCLLSTGLVQAQQRILGPDTGNPGEEVRLSVDGTKSPPLTDLASIADWAAKLEVVVDAPKGGTAVVEVDFSIDFKNNGVKPRLSVVASNPGLYVVVLHNGNEGGGLSTKRIQVGQLPPPPTPTPTPDPEPKPDPPQPPVVQGKRLAVIVRETGDQSPALARTVVALRAGKQAAYLKEKGHTLKLLDDDSKTEDGLTDPDLALVEPEIRGKPLPVLVVLTEDGRALGTTSLPAEFSADSVVEFIKKHGG